MKNLYWILAAIWLVAPGPLPAAESHKPNIVLILADDLRPDCLHALGNPLLKTPHLDRVVESGLIFRNGYTLGSQSGAVCTPSRTMIQTGQSYLRANRTIPTLAQTIKAAGYASIRSGKFDNNPNSMDGHFDQHVDGQTAEGNANNIIAFIKEHAGQKPLFLYFAPHEPHDPQYAPDNYYPMYQPTDIPLPPNFLPFHPFDNGEMTVRDETTLPWPRTRESVTGKLARYYASITYFDDQAGRILDALKQAGQFDNSIIIIAGDNGLSLGEHGLLGKQNVYEFGGMHVPLVFAGPGILRGQTKAFAYLMDIYPTLCDMAGIPVPAGLDAQSLAPILKGQQAKVRDYCFTAYKQYQRAIRDDRWKLIRYPLINKTQLFDLQADPHEMNDLSGTSELAGKVKEMLVLLDKTRKEYGDEAPLWVASPQNSAWSPSQANGEKPTKQKAKQ